MLFLVVHSRFLGKSTYLNMAGEPIIGEYRVGVKAGPLGEGEAV